MLIPPKYTLTTTIAQLLAEIEAGKEVINSVKIAPEIEANIRRQSTLKSSLYSARIEGNPLTLDQLSQKPQKDQKKIEVFNILKALNSIFSSKKGKIGLKDLLNFHATVMNNLVDKHDLGKLRNEASAIFNSAGQAIYLAPPPRHITNLLNSLLAFVNSPKEPSIPTKAVLAHFTFEKIHPFLDGNGRVGRLLIQSILHKNDYGAKGLLSLEEYLDNNRTGYYQALDNSEKDITDYLEFMLSAISDAAQNAKNLVLQKQEANNTDSLLPRRAEIYNIIKDHKLINFDFIRRRFVNVNERTLRFDLKKLADNGLIRKRGATKGVYYEVTSKI